MNENMKFKGMVSFKMTNSKGEVIMDKTVPNLVVTSGRDWAISRLQNNVSPVMSHIAVGTDGTAPVLGDVALGGELNRQAITSVVVSANTITYITRFNPGDGTGAIQEAGIFNNASGGDMLARTTFPVINKGSGDTLDISWTVTAL